MFGRFVLTKPKKSLADRFGLEEVLDLEPRYYIAPTQIIQGNGIRLNIFELTV